MPSTGLRNAIAGAGFSGSPSGRGLDASLDSAVLDRRGIAPPRPCALGPVTRGAFWEITSVPDIRDHGWKCGTSA